MLGLSAIRDTVTNVVEAITAALGIESEIVDDSLRIIGGTGRYRQKIGTFEEDGRVDSDEIYARLLRIGENYLCTDPQNDPVYNPKVGELAEITCPIQLGDRIVGLIGLIAFDEVQREKILINRVKLLVFLERMADLIASKLHQKEQQTQLKGIVDSMHEGLIAVDERLIITSVNSEAQNLLQLSGKELEGVPLAEIWDPQDIETVISTGVPIEDKETIYHKKGARSRRLLFSCIPLVFQNPGASTIDVHGAIILLQSSAEVRERFYKISVQDKHTTFDDIIGQSEAIVHAKKRTLQVSCSDSTILITGESGTGKELFARAIHAESPRHDNPFVVINCGAIPEMLIESELFGYEKGSFTGANERGKPGKFEIAHNGTLFLDEIGDLPLHLQVRLLHALQNRQIERIGGLSPIDIDVRVIAATNRDLEEMVAAGEFREDLFFRLNVIPLYIPPLRERDGDIELLLDFTLKKFNLLLQKDIDQFRSEALACLLAYDWPGNVRELENVVEYAVNMENGPEIRLENLPEKVVSSSRLSMAAGSFQDFSASLECGFLKYRLDEYQRQLIQESLDRHGRSTEGKIQAAHELGISESTLYRRIRELGVR